jgi:uncharacterized protein (DUF2147 family)
MWRVSPGFPVRIADAACALVLLACQPVRAALPPGADAKLLGLWMTEDRQGVVRIEPCGQAFCGRVVGISDFPPGGLRDIHGAQQCGLVIVHGLRLGEDGRRHGTITNPDDGKVYDAQMWVPADGDLRLRGFIGLPLFGFTQIWPHFAGAVTPDCHFVKP